jgi:hypothetical protein
MIHRYRKNEEKEQPLSYGVLDLENMTTSRPHYPIHNSFEWNSAKTLVHWPYSSLGSLGLNIELMLKSLLWSFTPSQQTRVEQA